jgi:hypothetical protein
LSGDVVPVERSVSGGFMGIGGRKMVARRWEELESRHRNKSDVVCFMKLTSWCLQIYCGDTWINFEFPDREQILEISTCDLKFLNE